MLIESNRRQSSLQPEASPDDGDYLNYPDFYETPDQQQARPDPEARQLRQTVIEFNLLFQALTKKHMTAVRNCEDPAANQTVKRVTLIGCLFQADSQYLVTLESSSEQDMHYYLATDNPHVMYYAWLIKEISLQRIEGNQNQEFWAYSQYIDRIIRQDKPEDLLLNIRSSTPRHPVSGTRLTPPSASRLRVKMAEVANTPPRAAIDPRSLRPTVSLQEIQGLAQFFQTGRFETESRIWSF